jgi:hypothetical protein
MQLGPFDCGQQNLFFPKPKRYARDHAWTEEVDFRTFRYVSKVALINREIWFMKYFIEIISSNPLILF